MSVFESVLPPPGATNITDDLLKSSIEHFLSIAKTKHSLPLSGGQLDADSGQSTGGRCLLLPPDFTRFHSQSGKISKMLYESMPNVEANEGMKVTDVMPALGTHAPMTEEQCKTMFGEEMCSSDVFRVHDWRNDVVTIGHAPPSMVSAATQGMVSKPWPAQLNKLVWEGRHDLVFSIGQVVPHEVMGMANYNKNLFVGVGGLDAINLSHFIGAVYGMENMMGKASNPLKDILNYASENFLENKLPLFYILTVMGTNADSGELEMKGLFFGNDIKCYLAACELSLSVNFTMLEEAPMKVVVHLDEDEFHSTWLGNKAIYRTRMAIATGGELIVLGPGVKRFGEDDGCDILIRKYGYVGTPKIMELMRENEDLQNNLSVVAHLIHGSSEGRFDITYCPGALSQEEVEKAGFKYADLDEMTAKYGHLKDGWGEVDGEKVFYISNPALGLWAHESRFEKGGNGREGSGGGEVPVGENQVGVGGSGGVGGNRG